MPMTAEDGKRDRNPTGYAMASESLTDVGNKGTDDIDTRRRMSRMRASPKPTESGQYYREM